MTKSDLDTFQYILSHLPVNFSLTDVLPANLAPLYRYAHSDRTGADCLGSEIKKRLLLLTCKQAKEQSDFYQNRFKHYDFNQFNTQKEFAMLPILSREEVETAGWSICSRNADYLFTSYTSGTTTKTPMKIHRCKQEQNYISTFYQVYDSFSDPTKAPLILLLTDISNGRRLLLPSNAYSFPVSSAYEQGLRQGLSLLDSIFVINNIDKRINTISGTFDGIKAFSAYLESEGRQDLTKNILKVQGTAQYQTSASREWLKKFWGTDIFDRYSLTEMIFGANLDIETGLFNFDLFGYPEVVNLHDYRRISGEGRGLLVLTSFFPFSQMMPLIRYIPGDLVEVIKTGPYENDLGFKLLGRRSDSLDLSNELGKGAFLGSGEALEAVEPIVGVRRREENLQYPLNVRGVSTKPYFTLNRNNQGMPRLQVELFYPPICFSNAIRDIKEEISRRIAQVNNDIGALIDQERFIVDIVKPGSIGSEPKVDC